MRIEIPESLTFQPRWVCYEKQLRGEVTTKVPIYTGGNASAINPATWMTIQNAIKLLETRGDGLGIVLGDYHWNNAGVVLTETTGLVGIDLDHCIVENKLTPGAAEVIRSLPDTYSEVSPSGTGIHLLYWVHEARLLRKGVVGYVSGQKVEVYSTARYFTFSGNRCGSMTKLATIAPSPLIDLMERLSPAVPKTPRVQQQPTNADQRLAKRILDRLDPAMAYEDWLAVGMALEGIYEDCGATWDAWSERDPKGYVPGQCESKAKGFKERKHSIGTLIHYAKDQGEELPSVEQERQASFERIRRILRSANAHH